MALPREVTNRDLRVRKAQLDPDSLRPMRRMVCLLTVDTGEPLSRRRVFYGLEMEGNMHYRLLEFVSYPNGVFI